MEKIKLFFMIILLSLFSLIMNIEYDLYSGYIKRITRLEANIEYYLYIKATQFQTANISFSSYLMSSPPFSNLTLYEYSSRNTDYSSFNKKYNHSIIFNENNGEMILNFTYTVSSIFTNYIALKLIPSSNLDYIFVRINIMGSSYELFNNEIKSIYNLISGEPYFFLIKATKDQTANVNLSIYNEKTNPFSYLIFYEFKDKNIASFNIYENISISSKIEGNELITSCSFSVSSDETNYIGIKLTPNYNIESISTKIIVGGCGYDLNKDVSNIINNLISGNTYYFFLEVLQYQNLNINLTMNNMTTKPFKFLEIYEFTNRTSSYSKSLNYKKEDIIINSKNDELISSFSYTVASYFTNYLVLKIIPLYNIDYFNAKFDAEGATYDFHTGEPKNITNLKNGVFYYFFIECHKGQRADLNISIDYSENISSLLLEIYEFEYRTSIKYKKYFSRTIKTSLKNDQSVLSFSYNVTSYDISYIAFKIKSVYNISFLNAKIDVFGQIDNSNTISLGIMFLILFLPCIGIIYCILILIYIIRIVNRKKNSRYLEMEQPLFNQIKSLKVSIP